jgi:hypothetical protein
MIEFDKTKTEWKEPIKNLYDVCKEELVWVYPSSDTEAFLSQIWKQSLEAFDKPREVQIVIDSNDNIYMSVGTSGFVSFENQEEGLTGMKLPIKCWIHTHPFGLAYFSDTDWTTINTWKGILDSAIVLGDAQYVAYNCKDRIAKRVEYGLYEQQKDGEEEE